MAVKKGRYPDWLMLKMARAITANFYYKKCENKHDQLNESFLNQIINDIAQQDWKVETEQKLKAANSKVDYVLNYEDQVVQLECKYIRNDKGRFPTEIQKDFEQLRKYFEFEGIWWNKLKQEHRSLRNYGYIVLAGYDNLSSGEDYLKTLEKNIKNRWDSTECIDASNTSTKNGPNKASYAFMESKVSNSKYVRSILEDIDDRYYCIIFRVLYGKKVV